MPHLIAPPTIHERVATAATKHDELVHTFTEVEYAPSAFAESAVYISSINSQIAEQQGLVDNLETQRTRNKASHQKLRDSAVRRLAFNVTGKKDNFAELLAREERQYLETAQALTKAEQGLEALKGQLSEAQKIHEDFGAAVAKRKETLQALDDLYESVFGGPTGAFPDEDQAELAVAEVGYALEAVRAKLHKEKQAYEKLEKAGVQLSKVVDYVIAAQYASRKGLESQGGDYMDRDEREALTNAKSYIGYYEGLMQAAKEIIPEVGRVGIVDIPKPYFRGDRYQNSTPRETVFHHLIGICREQVGEEVGRLKENKRLSNERMGKLDNEIDRLEKESGAAKDKLKKVRRDVFDSVTKELPPY